MPRPLGRAAATRRWPWYRGMNGDGRYAESFLVCAPSAPVLPLCLREPPPPPPPSPTWMRKPDRRRKRASTGSWNRGKWGVTAVESRGGSLCSCSIGSWFYFLSLLQNKSARVSLPGTIMERKIHRGMPSTMPTTAARSGHQGRGRRQTLSGQHPTRPPPYPRGIRSRVTWSIIPSIVD